MLTDYKLAAKRHARTISSRRKAQAKRTRFGMKAELTARNREKTASWLANLGAEQQQAQIAADERVRQAQESRRTKAAMSQHPSKGIIGRIRSLFRRTP